MTVTLTSQDYKTALTECGYTSIRYNVFSKEIEVNGQTYDEFVEADIANDMRDRGYSQRQVVKDCVLSVAAANAYDPIKDRFESLEPWDGVPRIRKFAEYLHPENADLAATLIFKWMTGAVSKLYNKTQNMVLVLQGAQGTGKSAVVEWLASPFDQEYFAADEIDPRSKDDQINACQTFIWEIAEMDSTMRKADFGALKRHITQKGYKVRLPYAARAKWIPVTCNYIGTVNDTGGFLNDPSGNRRFWIIRSNGIDFEYSTALNPAALWAEAYAAFKNKVSFKLTAAEAAANEQEQKAVEALDIVAETMTMYFDIDPDQKEWVMPIARVREILSRQSVLSSNELQDTRLGRAATRLNIERALRRHNGTPTRVYIGIKEKGQSYPPDKYDDEEPAETFTFTPPAGFECSGDDLDDIAI